MRGTWSKKVLEGRTTRVLERVETLDAVKGGREVGEWVSNVLNAAEVSPSGFLQDTRGLNVSLRASMPTCAIWFL